MKVWRNVPLFPFPAWRRRHPSNLPGGHCAPEMTPSSRGADAHGRVLDFGRTQASLHGRPAACPFGDVGRVRLARLRQRCRFAEAHHIKAGQGQGLSDLDNGICLCRFHWLRCRTATTGTSPGMPTCAGYWSRCAISNVRFRRLSSRQAARKSSHPRGRSAPGRKAQGARDRDAHDDDDPVVGSSSGVAGNHPLRRDPAPRAPCAWNRLAPSGVAGFLLDCVRLARHCRRHVTGLRARHHQAAHPRLIVRLDEFVARLGRLADLDPLRADDRYHWYLRVTWPWGPGQRPLSSTLSVFPDLLGSADRRGVGLQDPQLR